MRSASAFCIVFLFFIVFVPSVCAVSLSSLPDSQRTLLYAPGKEFVFDLEVGGAAAITVYPMGDFAEQVQVQDAAPGGGPEGGPGGLYAS
ncbi:MAG: hypothetical protein HC945_04160 [Nitrosarchaeum sp.]|nr:hypothetical protein [Nitrosarchaeum sp.]